MAPQVESLNAAVAGALLVYAARRQRQPSSRIRGGASLDEQPVRRSRRRGVRNASTRRRHRHAARRAHAAPHARRHRRPGAHPRARHAAAARHRARRAAVDHPLGTARHRQDHPGAGHRRADAGALRAVQRRARRHQGDQGGHGGGRGPPPPHRPADDRLRGRDPSLQQGAAGRVPAPGRSRRHRPHRRHHREPVVRGQRGAAVAVEGVRAARRSRRRPSSASCSGRSRIASAGWARWTSR